MPKIRTIATAIVMTVVTLFIINRVKFLRDLIAAPPGA